MKQPLLRAASLLLAAVILFSACKKDKDTPVTKESLAGNYKLEKLLVKSGGQEEDITEQQYDPCQLDDIITLAVDGTYSIDDTGEECVPAGDSEGTWELPSSSSIIVNGETYTLVSYDGSTLVYAQELEMGAITASVERHFKKQ